MRIQQKRNVFPVLTSAFEMDPGHHTRRGCCFDSTSPNSHLKSFFHFTSHMKNGTTENEPWERSRGFLPYKVPPSIRMDQESISQPLEPTTVGSKKSSFPLS